jgi:hypothetical protein
LLDDLEEIRHGYPEHEVEQDQQPLLRHVVSSERPERGTNE